MILDDAYEFSWWRDPFWDQFHVNMCFPEKSELRRPGGEVGRGVLDGGSTRVISGQKGLIILLLITKWAYNFKMS